MTLQKYASVAWALVIPCVYLLSWQLQSHLLLHFDVSWLTYAAQQLLAGGNYINNFLETNPPLIIYLYTPLAFLKQSLGMSLVEGTRLYLFTLATFSLLLCSRLLTALRNQHCEARPVVANHSLAANWLTVKDCRTSLTRSTSTFLCHFLLFMLAVIFLILPLNELGQRENLTVILAFPYLLLFFLRLQGNDTIGTPFSCVVGLMAGIGFCIKPYFLLPLGLLELYYLYRSKRFQAAFRPEIVSVAAFVCFYLLVIGLFHQDYIHQIIPLVAKFYYQRHQKSVLALLTREESVFHYFVILFYLLRHRQLIYPDLCKTLLIAAQGFWLAYLGQRMGWYYHALPFLSLDLVLAAILFLQAAVQKRFSWVDWLLTSVLVFGFMGYYFLQVPYINLNTHACPFSYFLLFFLIFFPLFYIRGSYRLSWKLVYSLALIFSVNGVIYKYLISSALYPYLFLMSASLLILTFGLFVPAATPSDKGRSILLSLLGLALFGLPAIKMAYIYNYSCSYKLLYSTLIDDMKKFAGQKVIYLSNASEMAFPNIDYSGQQYSSRFWSLIWLPEMKHAYKPETYATYFQKNQAVLQFYMAALVDDFKRNEPQFVFVDKRPRGYYYAAAPDYIRLFSLNPDFKRLWVKYHYRKTLGNAPLYKFDVYQRENSIGG